MDKEQVQNGVNESGGAEFSALSAIGEFLPASEASLLNEIKKVSPGVDPKASQATKEENRESTPGNDSVGSDVVVDKAGNGTREQEGASATEVNSEAGANLDEGDQDDPGADDDGAGNGKDDAEFEDEYDISQLPEEAQQFVGSLKRGIERLKEQREKAREKFEDTREELEQIKGELDKLRQAPPVVVPASGEVPLAHVKTFDELDESVTLARQTIQWCKKNKNGAWVQTPQGEREFSPEDVEDLKDRAEAVLEAAPDRRKWLEDYQKATETARKAYPKLREGDDGKRREVLLKSLAHLPDHELIIGDILVGEKVRRGLLVAVPKSKSKANPAATTAAQAGKSGQAGQGAGRSTATNTNTANGASNGNVVKTATATQTVQEEKFDSLVAAASSGSLSDVEKLISRKLGY